MRTLYAILILIFLLPNLTFAQDQQNVKKKESKTIRKSKKKKSSKGEEVKILQKKLNKDSTKSNTKNIKNKEIKISAEAKKNKPSSSEIDKYSSKTLKKGSKGQEAKGLQKQLRKNSKKIDKKTIKKDSGKYGVGSKGAVKDFQKKKKLGRDGVTGPKKIEKLVNKKKKDSSQYFKLK